MMMSPTIISMPFKLLLFVLVDGWAMMMGSLAGSVCDLAMTPASPPFAARRVPDAALTPRNRAFPSPWRVERSRDTATTVTSACLDFARHDTAGVDVDLAAGALMDADYFLGVANQTMWVLALAAAPVLIPALLAGLILGMVQAATSINEQTLTFVPKLLVVGIALVIFGGMMMGLLSDFTIDIFGRIPDLVK